LTGSRDRPEGGPAILVVEHDPQIGGPTVDQLVADGYQPRLARTAEHARVLARTHRPAAALLGELELPRASLELLAEIRGGQSTAGTKAERFEGEGFKTERFGTAGFGTERFKAEGFTAEGPWPAQLPVIVVSSHAQEPDLLRAFEAGADDFIARPASYLELRARLCALLGRVGPGGGRGQRRMQVGPLRIDLRAHTVSLRGHPVELRRLEHELLLHLAHEPESVWVVNVRGVGYRLI
jgi:DNA-binding response OmpR family regulator